MSIAPRVPAPRTESAHLPVPGPLGASVLGGSVLGTPSLGGVGLPAPSLGSDLTSRPRRSRGRGGVEATPLGSLTQREHRPDGGCRECGSHHVTRLSLCLTDGTPVEFTSCHRCEHRTWEHAGIELSVDAVLTRSRKS